MESMSELPSFPYCHSAGIFYSFLSAPKEGLPLLFGSAMPGRSGIALRMRFLRSVAREGQPEP